MFNVGAIAGSPLRSTALAKIDTALLIKSDSLSGKGLLIPKEAASAVARHLASGFASNGVATEYRSVAYEYRRIALLEAAKHLILKPDLSAKALETKVR